MSLQPSKSAPKSDAAIAALDHLMDRAYALARAGEAASLSALKHRLESEGFQDVASTLHSPMMLRRLKGIIARVRAD